MIPIEHFVILSAILFCLGLVIVIVKKNAVVILMGIELMLNAANINLVAFSKYDPTHLGGQMFAIFVIVIAAAESAIALAIVLRIVKQFNTTDVDDISQLKG